MAQVDFSQEPTLLKHTPHVSYPAGVEILKACDRLQAAHRKPCIGTGGFDTSELRGKHDGSYLRVITVGIPAGNLVSRVLYVVLLSQ